MSETPKVYQAIIDVMKRVNAIPKDSKNRDQGFSYRSIDAVMAELHDIMAEVGLFVVPTVLSVEDGTRIVASGKEWNHVRALIAYDFYASDGSTVRAIVRGEALDSGDKASNKALAIALKYVATQTFMIPTEDAKDPDEVTPNVETAVTSKPAVKPVAKATPSIDEILDEVPTEEVWRNSTGRATCTTCGKAVSQAEEDYSLKNFNKILCLPCQAKERAKGN